MPYRQYAIVDMNVYGHPNIYKIFPNLILARCMEMVWHSCHNSMSFSIPRMYGALGVGLPLSMIASIKKVITVRACMCVCVLNVCVGEKGLWN